MIVISVDDDNEWFGSNRLFDAISSMVVSNTGDENLTRYLLAGSANGGLFLSDVGDDRRSLLVDALLDAINDMIGDPDVMSRLSDDAGELLGELKILLDRAAS